MSTRHLQLLTLLLLPLLAGCPGEREQPIVTPTDPYVGALGEARITTSEWIAHVALLGARSGQGAATVAQRLLDDPILLDRTLEDALVSQRLRERARQILPLLSDEELADARERDPRLFEALDRLDPAHVPEALRERMIADSARLLHLPPEQPGALLGQQLRARWQARNAEIDALLITLPNDFSNAEVETWLEEKRDEVRAWFDDEGAALLGAPTRVLVSIIGLPAARDDEGAANPRVLEAAARALGATLTPDNFADMARQYSVDRTREAGGDLGWREPEDVPGLPRGEAGDILGPVRHGQHWVYYHIREIEEATDAEWNERSAFRAATHLLRRDHQSEAARAWLEHIAELDDPAELSAWAEDERVRVTELPRFHAHPEGFIPVLGNAPALHDAIFADDAPNTGLLPHVEHQQVRLHTLWIRERVLPDDERFEEEAESFTERLREELRLARIQRLEESIRSSVPRVFDTAAAGHAIRHALLDSPDDP